MNSFHQKIEAEKKKNPRLRRGQIAFDLMMKEDPEKAILLMGSIIDPYYNDAVIIKFVNVCFDIK
jgi:hypothetical protein